MPDLIQIYPTDNVAVTLRTIPAGTKYLGIAARTEIPQEHKMALTDIQPGEQIVKYGFSMKLSTNTALAEKKKAWIDFNTGVVADGMQTLAETAENLMDAVLEVASGRQVKAEAHGFREISIFKDGVTLQPERGIAGITKKPPSWAATAPGVSNGNRKHNSQAHFFISTIFNNSLTNVLHLIG